MRGLMRKRPLFDVLNKNKKCHSQSVGWFSQKIFVVFLFSFFLFCKSKKRLIESIERRTEEEVKRDLRAEQNILFSSLFSRLYRSSRPFESAICRLRSLRRGRILFFHKLRS